MKPNLFTTLYVYIKLSTAIIITNDCIICTGLSYDGMFWHQLDKFIFANCRYAVTADDSDTFAKVRDARMY